MLGRTRRRLSAVLSPTIVRRWRALLFWSEVLSRRLAHGFAAAAAGVKPRTRVLFYPSLPGLHMIALKLCLALGWGVTADPSKRADIVFHWNSSTFAEVDGTLESLASRHRVLNRECVDISKTNVNRAVSYTHLRAHETDSYLVCRLLLE